ncbi:hypothetical protein [Roseibium suaedae]|uniref:Uncharacterized protein n=1 Tax=Roseibium suaedae TaxID=735517 RepID=A0A1M7MF80_9HYPH|nr:hypothetical protein [Roseibium suaedae]SHM89460.1 hypothetical protein SAMN05444272_3383 [Roseibium suaedae]
MRVTLKSSLAGVLAAALMFTSVSSQALAFSDEYESAPEQAPAAILEGVEAGAGYQVETPVRSDGFMRLYDIRTTAGTEHLSGDGLIKLRIRELQVLHVLEGLETQKTFLDGLKEAAKQPASFVESTVSDPIGTAKSTVSGVGRLFSRIGKGVEEAVTGQGGSATDLARSITGQARARRELALKLGVDPYTTYPPLSAKLDQAATVSTAGNLSVSAIMALIPGGIVTNALGSADNMRTLIVDSTRNELEQRAVAVLRDLRISDDVIFELSRNTNYTPSERVVLAYQLQTLSSLEGLQLLAAKAAAAQTRDEAYFQLRRVVLTRYYNEGVASLGSIRMVAGFPIALRRDGAAALILPLDMVAWTEETASAFVHLNEGLKALPFPPDGADFLITGDITPMAAERIASLGWQITADMPMPEGPVF